MAGKNTTQKTSLPKAPLLDLFPPVTPYSSGYLEVDPLHNIYWEQSGNPDGVPILLLHGGPGAGAGATHRRFFDPDHYRIIIFDQRGAGRSTPLGELRNNTTQHLLQDIETLRQHLNVENWHLFGGSWGCTLALLYAINHPQRCLSLILRGVFLCEQSEIDWFFHGIQTIFPEAWEQFISPLNEGERSDILQSYNQHLNHEDSAIQMKAATAWAMYESACSALVPNYDLITTQEQKFYALALARIEAHYFQNEVIAEEDSILHHIATLKNIPTTIIQGRYDMICPIHTAYKLHQAWPEARYIVVPDAGHSALDPSMRSQLIEATENARTIR